MGVLDDLEEKLKGTQGVVVETPLTPGGGALDKLAERLRKDEDINFFMRSDEALTGKKIEIPKPGQLPQVSDQFRARFEDPTKSTEAMAAARAAEIRAKAAQAGLPTMGPATEKKINTPMIDFAPTEAQRIGKMEIESESYDAGKLQVLSQFIDRAMGAVHGASTKTYGALVKLGDWIEKTTGLPKGGLFDRMASDAKFYEDYFNARSGRVRGKQEDLPEAGKIMADTAGHLLWDLPQIMALGPYGLAVHGAAYGLADGGVEGMIAGGLQGALTHGVFRGIGGLPSLWQAPAALLVGSGTAALETDDPRQIIASGVTWGVLQGQGGRQQRSVKQFLEESPIAQDIKGAYKTIKGEQAVKKLWDGRGVSREEFILRFPEMKAHMNDYLAEGVMKGLNPDLDPQALRDAGGALKVMEWTLGPIRAQHRLAVDMVRARMGLPKENVAVALQSMAEKMNDVSLRDNHYMAKLRIKDGGDMMAVWQESVYRGELERRGVDPMLTGEEYVTARYGPQGWDEITGMNATERQASENVIQLLNRRGILTGEAAANAEADTDPAQGPINPAILKAMFNSEVARLMGLKPMHEAPQWADLFQARTIPRKATLGQPTDSRTVAQIFLGTGRSRGYTTAAGYVMVPAPNDHPRANPRGLIPWHQLVMENKLGRILTNDEVVHHVNHKPWDNSPDNLVVMGRDEHIIHHKSAEGRAIDQAIYEAEMAKGPDTVYRIENFDTMEMRQASEAEPVGPREYKTSIQKPSRGRPITEFVEAGEKMEPWEIRQASKGRVQFGPQGEPPLGSTLPSGERFMGLERFKIEKNGDVSMIAHVKDADGQMFTRELTRLTPDEAARYRANENIGDLIDDIVDRVSQERPAGGLPVKELKPGELAAKDVARIQDRIEKLRAKLDETVGGTGWNKDHIKYTGQKAADIEDKIEALKSQLAGKPQKKTGGGKYMLETVRAPFVTRYADADTEPGPGEILTMDGEVVKKGDGVTQRLLDRRSWPKPEEAPAGTPDYPEGLFLNEAYKSNEQPTVRDVVSGHNENGASTVNIYDGDMAGTDMWAVSLFPERTAKIPGAKVTKDQIYKFMRENADLLSSDPRLNVGTWYNKEDGITYVDVTALLPKRDAALAESLGRKYNQIAVTLLDKEFNFPSVNTGGTGEPLADAGWLPEAERMGELYKTGDELELLHFGRPDTTPHSMGYGSIGEEARQFETLGGKKTLRPGFYLKSNFYTPKSDTVEPHMWGGKIFGAGKIDRGQLFDARERDPESNLTLDQQAVRAGKRGWYDASTEQVRLFTPEQLQREGIYKGPAKDVGGANVRDFIERDNPNLMAKPGDPVEDYSKSNVFGIVAPGTNDTADAVNRLRFLLFDKFHPVHQMTKLAEAAGLDVPLMKNPSYMVKLLGGLTGKGDAKVFYRRFVIDQDGKVQFTGKSLKNILAPHKGNMDGLDDWLWARAEREEHRLNKRRGPDDQVKTELTEQEAERIYQAGVGRYGQTGKEFTEYMNSLLDELADAGLMKKADVADLKKTRPDYAPLRKDLDEIAAKLDSVSGNNSARQTLDRVKNPLRKRRGTEKDYARIPPSQAAVLMTYEITSAVERNRAAQAIVELRKMSPEMAKIIAPTRPKITYVRDISTGKDVPTIGRQEADTVAVSIDGTRHFFKVPEDVAQSMKLIYETGLGRWTKLMAIPARTLRTGATAAPEFAFRNPLRDWLTAFMNAKKGFNPLTDFSRGLFQLIFHEKGPATLYKAGKMDPEAYWKWKASGGEWSMLVSLDKSLGEQAVRQMHKETDTGLKAMRKYIKTPLGYLEAISEAGEKPTRLGVFERTRRAGMSDVEAAIESREASTDFAVRGAETKSMSALYTFLNARAQTTMKLGKTAVENPVRFAMKGLAAAGIPSLVLYAINRNDPDYWKRDQMERDLYWFLPIDIGGRQVKIPKGEIGLIFGTAVEKVLEYLDHEGVIPAGKGERPPLNPEVTEFLEEIFKNMMPVGNWGEALPTFARPIAEWVNNKSYYYGTPLESEADKGVAPYLRYKPGTSEVMKELGKSMGVFNKGKGVSPIMMENTLRGYTGGVGRHALRGVDIAADFLGVTDKGARPKDVMNVPGLAGFASRRAVGFEGQPAKTFYEMAEKIDMTKKTLGELLKDKTKSKEVLTWIEQHPEEMRLIQATRTRSPETGEVSDLFNDAKRQLADLRKQMNMISENKSLTGEQKRQALDYLDKQVSKIVDPLWRLISAASQTPSKK
jgi:hypothetical protein